MNKYQDQIQQSLISNIKNITLSEILENNKFVLYGAGSGFMTFAGFIKKQHSFMENVLMILDIKFKPGDTFNSLLAFSPFNTEAKQHSLENAIGVITSGKTTNHAKMISHLKDLGIKNIILAGNYIDYFGSCVTPELLKEGKNFYNKQKKSIFSVINLLEDDISRNTYVNFVKSYIDGQAVTDFEHYPEAEEYFPSDIPILSKYKRTIDCGAYIGDTALKIYEQFGKIDKLVCFEPDNKNFNTLVKTISKNRHIADEIILYPCGIYNKSCLINFEDGMEVGSKITETGKNIAQCISIDEALPDFKPTTIKMDIEGAELSALKGAQKTIQKYKPDLIVCVYHLPNHIWDIPLYIDSLNLKYKFYIRNYSGNPLDTVLYAV